MILSEKGNDNSCEYTQVYNYERLIASAEKAIVLLQERRTALISAAVTGKIDVRNRVAPEFSKTNKEEVPHEPASL